MKQLLQNLRSGELRVEEVPIPALQPGAALVRVAASLVSAGTERMLVEFAEKTLLGKARTRPDLVRQVLDRARREGVLSSLQAALHRLDQPMPLGYSSAGTIVALGEGMIGFQVGQRVACAGLNHAVHAEYNLVPRNLLAPIPEGVDFESAAFTTLGAIALHGFRLAEPQIGESVAVIGMGLLGLLTAQIATAAGCHVLGIDPDPERLRLASSLDLRVVARREAEPAAQTFTAGRGFDVILICAATRSNDPVELAGAIARDRARVVALGAVGLTLPRKVYYEKELSFINSRSYGPGRYDPIYEERGIDYPIGYVRWTENRNMQAVLDLMAQGRLNVAPLITHRFPIEQATTAYQVITGRRKEPFLGVILTYPGADEALPSSRVTLSAPRPTRTLPLDRPRLGLIGAGTFATGVLLPALRKAGGVDLVGVASLTGLHAHHAARRFGFRYATSSAEDLLRDETINLVAIATRHHDHADLTIAALQAGKHVFVEKPLAITAEQLQAVIEQLQKEGNGLLMVGFNRRFAPLAHSLKAFFTPRTEPLFIHYRVNAGFLPLTHWTQDEHIGGGRILGEACHFVDFLTFLVGSPPSSVVAHALPDGGKYRQDNVTMTFTFPDGSLGVVTYLANGDKSFPKERVEVFCGGAVAVLDDFRALELIRDGHKTRRRTALDKGWVDEWKAFLQAIRQAGLPPIPYDHLIGVTRATLAAVESLRHGSTQVTLRGDNLFGR